MSPITTIRLLTTVQHKAYKLYCRLEVMKLFEWVAMAKKYVLLTKSWSLFIHGASHIDTL